MTERLLTNGPSFLPSSPLVTTLPLEVHFEALLTEERMLTPSPSLAEPSRSCDFCLEVLLLEMVEDSDTSVSDDSELLQQEPSDMLGGLCCEAEVMVEAREEAREGTGLDTSRLLLLTVRTLLRLRPRLISTTSMEGGSTALGMILDMYAACGDMDMTGLGGACRWLLAVVIQGTARD